MKKYKTHFIFLGSLVLLCLLFLTLGEYILPFFIGWLIALITNPIIRRIQRFIPSRAAAVTIFISLVITVFVSIIVLFSSEVIHDFERLNQAFITFADDNSETIDATTQQIKTFITNLYPSSSDSLNWEDELKKIEVDSAVIGKSVDNLVSIFKSTTPQTKPFFKEINWLMVMIYAIGYYLCIIYTYSYFEEKSKKYFSGIHNSPRFIDQLLVDFKRVFIPYFKQRTIVVIICMFIFITTFLIIGIPGAIIIGVIAGLLCYASHFHYLALIPLLLGCWVLSVEQEQSFFLYFGIVFGLCILVSILEELVFVPKIMTEASAMNPAIMMLGFSIWGYLLGFTGIVLAIPLTNLILIYLDKVLMYRKRQLAKDEK